MFSAIQGLVMSVLNQPGVAADGDYDAEAPQLFAFLPPGGVASFPGCGPQSTYIFCNKVRMNPAALGKDKITLLDQNQKEFVLNIKGGKVEGKAAILNNLS